MTRIESLLSARMFVVPQVVGDRLFFVSNLSGRLSLYAMDRGGSVPEPLLPPNIALQNPHLMEGKSFVVFPGLGRILVMVDRDGDEVYQPMWIPLEGGFPEPAFGGVFEGDQISMAGENLDDNMIYLLAQSRSQSLFSVYRASLATGDLLKMGESMYGNWPAGTSRDYQKAILIDAYGAGDHVLYFWREGEGKKLLYGTPLEAREPGQEFRPNSINSCYFTNDDKAILCTTSLFSDAYGLAYMELDRPEDIRPVEFQGIRHSGIGELDRFEDMEEDNRFLVGYNIDGCSWVYEARFDPAALTMTLERVLCGEGELSAGVLESLYREKATGRYAFSFSTAVSPTQIYTLEAAPGSKPIRQTSERVLGIPADWLSAGEDASFVSHDGLRISARLYLPAAALEFEGKRPVVYYIHGGPQGQERPDFAWFSMPLIQFLTLNGFAVFVPNVRGSTGYGFAYMNHVVRDWGGQDRLDHVHAMTHFLPKDSRLDTKRAAVVGRSYGGYMTLTLSSRHAELWAAAVDMFGPYDLLTFANRVPESWKPLMAFLVGDPVTEKEMLIERSPRTYIQQIQAPLLVIQGKNDPRVIEQESRELVEELRGRGNQVEYLMFEDEGHDVLKYENRVRCYNTITDFFKKHLRP